MSELPRRRRQPHPERIDELKEEWEEPRWLNEGGEQHVSRPMMEKKGDLASPGPRAARLEEERRAAASHPKTRHHS